jgi:hypothetical protein
MPSLLGSHDLDIVCPHCGHVTPRNIVHHEGRGWFECLLCRKLIDPLKHPKEKLYWVYKPSEEEPK